MNRVKKGTADVMLDYDKVIGALQSLNESLDDSQSEKLLKLSSFERSALLFNVLNLLKNEEFAVRDYALHSAR